MTKNYTARVGSKRPELIDRCSQESGPKQISLAPKHRKKRFLSKGERDEHSKRPSSVFQALETASVPKPSENLKFLEVKREVLKRKQELLNQSVITGRPSGILNQSLAKSHVSNFIYPSGNQIGKRHEPHSDHIRKTVKIKRADEDWINKPSNKSSLSHNNNEIREQRFADGKKSRQRGGYGDIEPDESINEFDDQHEPTRRSQKKTGGQYDGQFQSWLRDMICCQSGLSVGFYILLLGLLLGLIIVLFKFYLLFFSPNKEFHPVQTNQPPWDNSHFTNGKFPNQRIHSHDEFILSKNLTAISSAAPPNIPILVNTPVTVAPKTTRKSKLRKNTMKSMKKRTAKLENVNVKSTTTTSRISTQYQLNQRDVIPKPASTRLPANHLENNNHKSYEGYRNNLAVTTALPKVLSPTIFPTTTTPYISWNQPTVSKLIPVWNGYQWVWQKQTSQQLLNTQQENSQTPYSNVYTTVSPQISGYNNQGWSPNVGYGSPSINTNRITKDDGYFSNGLTTSRPIENDGWNQNNGILPNQQNGYLSYTAAGRSLEDTVYKPSLSSWYNGNNFESTAGQVGNIRSTGGQVTIPEETPLDYQQMLAKYINRLKEEEKSHESSIILNNTETHNVQRNSSDTRKYHSKNISKHSKKPHHRVKKKKSKSIHKKSSARKRHSKAKKNRKRKKKKNKKIHMATKTTTASTTKTSATTTAPTTTTTTSTLATTTTTTSTTTTKSTSSTKPSLFTTPLKIRTFETTRSMFTPVATYLKRKLYGSTAGYSDPFNFPNRYSDKLAKKRGRLGGYDSLDDNQNFADSRSSNGREEKDVLNGNDYNRDTHYGSNHNGDKRYGDNKDLSEEHSRNFEDYENDNHMKSIGSSRSKKQDIKEEEENGGLDDTNENQESINRYDYNGAKASDRDRSQDLKQRKTYMDEDKVGDSEFPNDVKQRRKKTHHRKPHTEINREESKRSGKHRYDSDDAFQSDDKPNEEGQEFSGDESNTERTATKHQKKKNRSHKKTAYTEEINELKKMLKEKDRSKGKSYIDRRLKLLANIHERIEAIKEREKKRKTHVHKKRKQSISHADLEKRSEIMHVKVKSCKRVKQFPPGVFARIKKGPIFHNGKIIYIVRACRKEEIDDDVRVKCKDIEYKLSSGGLSVKRDKLNKKTIFTIYACRKNVPKHRFMSEGQDEEENNGKNGDEADDSIIDADDSDLDVNGIPVNSQMRDYHSATARLQDDMHKSDYPRGLKFSDLMKMADRLKEESEIKTSKRLDDKSLIDKIQRILAAQREDMDEKTMDILNRNSKGLSHLQNNIGDKHVENSDENDHSQVDVNDPEIMNDDSYVNIIKNELLGNKGKDEHRVRKKKLPAVSEKVINEYTQTDEMNMREKKAIPGTTPNESKFPTHSSGFYTTYDDHHEIFSNQDGNSFLNEYKYVPNNLDENDRENDDIRNGISKSRGSLIKINRKDRYMDDGQDQNGDKTLLKAKTFHQKGKKRNYDMINEDLDSSKELKEKYLDDDKTNENEYYKTNNDDHPQMKPNNENGDRMNFESRGKTKESSIYNDNRNHKMKTASDGNDEEFNGNLAAYNSVNKKKDHSLENRDGHGYTGNDNFENSRINYNRAMDDSVGADNNKMNDKTKDGITGRYLSHIYKSEQKPDAMDGRDGDSLIQRRPFSFTDSVEKRNTIPKIEKGNEETREKESQVDGRENIRYRDRRIKDDRMKSGDDYARVESEDPNETDGNFNRRGHSKQNLPTSKSKYIYKNDYEGRVKNDNNNEMGGKKKEDIHPDRTDQSLHSSFSRHPKNDADTDYNDDVNEDYKKTERQGDEKKHSNKMYDEDFPRLLHADEDNMKGRYKHKERAYDGDLDEKHEDFDDHHLNGHQYNPTRKIESIHLPKTGDIGGEVEVVGGIDNSEERYGDRSHFGNNKESKGMNEKRFLRSDINHEYNKVRTTPEMTLLTPSPMSDSMTPDRRNHVPVSRSVQSHHSFTAAPTYRHRTTLHRRHIRTSFPTNYPSNRHHTTLRHISTTFSPKLRSTSIHKRTSHRKSTQLRTNRHITAHAPSRTARKTTPRKHTPRKTTHFHSTHFQSHRKTMKLHRTTRKPHMTTNKRGKTTNKMVHKINNSPRDKHNPNTFNMDTIFKRLEAMVGSKDGSQKPKPTPPLSSIPVPIPHVVPLHNPKTINILCFGDSLTAGYNKHGKSFYPYCSRLKSILMSKTHLSVTTDTRGVVGEMTHKQMTGRLPMVFGNATSPYDWVIILGGTNDILHVKNFADDQEFLNQLENVWQPRITKDIEKLHQISYKYGAHTMLLTVPENAIEIWPEYKPLMTMRGKINDALRRFAYTSNGKTVLCDTARKVPRHSLSPMQEALFWDDHLHMTPTGYDKMAMAVSNCLEPYLPHSNNLFNFL